VKTIGLLAGMSWESSIEYYRFLNQMVRERAGGLSSARLVISSVNFAPLSAHMHDGRWDLIAETLGAEAARVERAGADFLVLGTNSMHHVADAISSAVSIPFLHIVDPTGAAIAARGLKTVGLLGTRFTMEKEFFKGRLQKSYGIETVVPGDEDRALVHRVIFDELCLGVVTDASRAAYGAVIDRLVARGAEGVILGCTEIGLLLKDGDCTVPLFDTTRLHAAAAVDLALAA